MPKKKAGTFSQTVMQLAHDVEAYPRSFNELLKFFMEKHGMTVEAAIERMHMSESTIKRLRLPSYRPSISEIHEICHVLKLNIIDALQLIRSAGYDPTSCDCEMINLITSICPISNQS